jgi:hypothetical protein
MKCFQPRTKSLPNPKPGDEFGKRLVQTLSEMESDRMNSTVFGLNTESTANYIPGVSAANDRWEYKQLVGGTGVTVTHGTGTITFSPNYTVAYRAITALRTLDTTDYQIECISGTYTVTLPTAVGITGRVYSIKNSGTGVITVACNGAQTIDGAATAILNIRDNIVVMSNNANWIVI